MVFIKRICNAHAEAEQIEVCHAYMHMYVCIQQAPQSILKIARQFKTNESCAKQTQNRTAKRKAKEARVLAKRNKRCE